MIGFLPSALNTSTAPWLHPETPTQFNMTNQVGLGSSFITCYLDVQYPRYRHPFFAHGVVFIIIIYLFILYEGGGVYRLGTYYFGGARELVELWV